MREHRALDVYVAGGLVRDVVLGEMTSSKDIDFFVDGPSVDEVLAQLAGEGTLCWGPFGSPRWMPPGCQEYADFVPIPRFFNGLWRCEDILDALNQFDFTGNALAIDLKTDTLFDPQHGLRDLASRVMRAVRFDYPDEPITPGSNLTRLEVLWFRLLHYAAARELRIEPLTARWLLEHRRFESELPAFTASFFPPHPRTLAALETVVVAPG
jgi:hypothetical protein